MAALLFALLTFYAIVDRSQGKIVMDLSYNDVKRGRIT